MIEGGGLGEVEPDEIGPLGDPGPERRRRRRGRRRGRGGGGGEAGSLLLPGSRREWAAPDQEALRELVPERGRRAYDVREAVEGSPTRAR